MKNRRGMAMIVAIMLLCLIGVSLTALTERLGSQYLRLQWQTDAAQARQILIAATHALLTDPSKPVALPAALSEGGSNVRAVLISHSSNQFNFRIDVTSRKFHASETVQLNQSPIGWTIAAVELQ